MRLPLDNLYVTNPFGQAGYGVFGKHAGVDLRASVGTNLYAPADGVITERYVGSASIQVLSMRIGTQEHRFLHLSSMFPTVGESVKEGQLIGKTGNSGNVAAHLHWDVRKAGTEWNRSFADYVDPLTLINKGGSEVANAAQVNNIYKAVLNREGDPGGIKNYTGKDANFIISDMMSSAEYKAQDNFLKTASAAIADQKATIDALSARPTKEQLAKAIADLEASRQALAAAESKVGEVKIVEKEVIKEVNPSWLEAAILFIRNVLRIK